MIGNLHKRNYLASLFSIKKTRNAFYRSAKPIAIISFALLLCFYAKAQITDDGIPDAPQISRLTGASFALNNSVVKDFATGVSTERDHKIVNIVRLKINEEFPNIIASDFTVKLTVKIEYGHNSYGDNSIDQTLTVTYKKASGVKYDAKNYFSFEGAEHVRVSITAIDAVTPANVGAANIGDLVAVENEMRVTRYYNLLDGVLPTMGTTNLAPDELGVSWSWPSNSGHTHTQLEWTWLEPELQSAYYNDNGNFDVNLLFNNSSTRIDLKHGNDSYNIPILYGAGILYYRIRAVNIKNDGTRKDGDWTAVMTQNLAGHNADLNWQSTVSFAEEGKRKVVIQYFDGSLRSRQTVTKDNSTNTIVTAETLYDGEGRPAVQVLPAPAPKTITTIGYTPGLNLFKSNTDLNLPSNQTVLDDAAAFFDLEPVNSTVKIKITPELQTAKGAARYYSTANPDKDDVTQPVNKNIPDAKGYPYTVTRYTPDATGRIMMQSGVGAEMRMGSGHETKYYYGTPAKEELDGLFGTEVGFYKHYFKNMVRDANGQMSVSYVDMHGRTIATALAGENPANLTSLDLSQYPNQQSAMINRNLLGAGANLVKNNSLEAVNSILVPYRTLYTFKYDLTPDKMQLASCTGTQLCFDCMYDLEISVTDESGDNPPVVHKFTNLNLNADNDCNTPVQLFKDASGNLVSNNQIVIPITLDPGSYIVRKTLTISEASLQKYKDQLFNPQSGIGICKTEQQIIDSLYTVLQAETNCNLPPATDVCAECNTALGSYATYRASYLLSNPTATEAEITAEYDEAKLNCDRLCNNTSQDLASIKEQMIYDMMAYTGQYSRALEEGETATSMYNKYNINPATNTAGQDFAAAEALLPQHPEYQRLVLAQSLSSSYDWLYTFQNTDDYATAVTNGYLFTSAANLTDPFYNAATAKKTAMGAKFTGAYQNNLSMWQIAYGSVMCKGVADPVQTSSCFNTVLSIPSSLNALTTQQKDEVWRAFRQLYASERTKDFYAYIHEQKPLPNNDEQDLVNQGYLLRFPASFDQMAQQFGNAQGSSGQSNDWTWYTSSGGTPNISGMPGGSTASQVYQSRCTDYVDQWKLTLSDCPTLAGLSNKDQVLTEITNAMVVVCQKGSNDANPYGASTVDPNLPVDGSYRSFEEIILSKFQQYGIPLSDVCNPYTITAPKPYGAGRRLTDEVIAVVQTCQCDQLAKLKTEAAAAGKNPEILTELNQYLLSKYNETLTAELYNAMVANCPKLGGVTCTDVIVPGTQCTERVCDNLDYFALTSPQPFPAFLHCGFDGSKNCVTCAYLTDLTTQYNAKFPGNPAPVMPSASHELTNSEIANNILYQQFLNYHTGFNYTWLEYMNAAATTSCVLTNGGNATAYQTVICGNTKALNDPIGIVEIESPCVDVKAKAIAWAHEIYLSRQRKLVEDFEASYKAKCMAVEATEHFTVEYQNKEYHYTLYYYDMAGNLVKTVPPKGVRPNFAPAYIDQVEIDKAADVFNPRPHVLITQYRYNSLNQVVAQNSPDANTSKFWYDRLGRLVVSQNAKQALENKYSYTVYDELGRITEVGQKPQTNVMDQTISQVDASLANWLNAGSSGGGGSKEQITKTGYDLPFLIEAFPNGGLFAGTENELSNLRNRVSYTKTQNTESTDPLEYYTAAIYTYDIHGNVDRLLQDYKGIPEMVAAQSRLVKLVYDYDLISGKVNKVSYRPPSWNTTTNEWNTYNDAFYHRYYYDAENRLTSVETSRDNIEWEREAAYSYYKHGPLARTVLGQQQVQGIDYMYTLQGWLKGVNPASSVAANNEGCASGSAVDDLVVTQRDATTVYTARQSITFDPGFESGTNDAFDTNIDANLLACTQGGGGSNPPVTAWDETQTVARDAYNFSLNYFPNDYAPIGTSAPNFVNVLTPLSTNAAPLFNGNIAAMTVNIAKLNGANVYNYHYDQLNRLVNMDVFTGLTATGFTPSSIPDYKEQITYDPNGNILTYFRNGTTAGGKGLPMDDITYQYPRNTTTGEPINNRLRYVGDITSAYTEDIKPQTALNRTQIFAENLPEQASDNYKYDAIGNLIYDGSENITNIQWTVYGKIKAITKNGSDISYTYDASGNRITKTVGSKTTIYVRDASGNVISVYEKTTELKNIETHIYGSNRLGIDGELTTAPTNVSLAAGFVTAKLTVFTRGEKLFELSNHLGNVLATVNDKKMGHDAGNGTIDYYLADVISASDYAPFGMQMVERKWSSSVYRYGFNGKENDNEVNGEGNQQDYGMRIYDPRLGRFLSVDPLTKEYPWYTPYQFASNNPVIAIDVDGLESSNDKNPTASSSSQNAQLDASEVVNTVRYLEQIGSHVKSQLDYIQQVKNNIKFDKSQYWQSLTFESIGSFTPSYWFAEALWTGLGGKVPSDGWVESLATDIGYLNNAVARLNQTANDYGNTVATLKKQLEEAKSIKLDNGIVLDKIGLAAAVGAVHKNSKQAFGDWVLYEIKVDGETFKFGIADKSRIRPTGTYKGIPERLAQQISALERKVPQLSVTWREVPLLQMVKAKALEFEANAIKAFAEVNGVPMGNVKEIALWAEKFGISGLSAKAIKYLKPFLKLPK